VDWVSQKVVIVPGICVVLYLDEAEKLVWKNESNRYSKRLGW